ncbi:hypothetical protein NDU88_001781 [Pleurodeles waltl]|uniref:Sulfotransferase n=1 Tax=Pleurodeles waltl TaxID=8319 RepID=A0AAV7VXE6_PLEWA|nr:hypothetical protein NDU88_001781 [Pleurodeles waltl]
MLYKKCNIKGFLSFSSVPWGSYFDHAVAWNKHIDEENVMVITYEDQTEDLARGIQKIAEFFGFTLNEKQIQHIVNRATFEAMKARSPETHVDLAQAHFRKGVVGDWKNYFTEAQNREMDAKFEEFLAGTKLGKQLKYDVYCKT